MGRRRDHAAAAAGLTAIAVGFALLVGRDGRSPIDCEAVGAGAIAQPAGAWSALAIAAIGIWVAATASDADPDRDHAAALAVAGVGGAAFLTHATATVWARRLDGLAVAVLAVVLLVVLARRQGRRLGVLGPGVVIVGVLALSADPLVTPATLAIVATGVGLAVGQHPRLGRSHGLALATGTAFVVGGAFWFLGRDGGPWCNPDSLLQPHAGWHLSAALGITLLIRYLRSGDSQPVAPPTLG